ncbi:hypothetical protein [Actinophytocola glycyrrhizae]|uniref:Secreted protein n=1 Tax=Actinophytocola glycyrrhizae TaxID=2044873 RepID=A0ABV9S8R3_9PSEU
MTCPAAYSLCWRTLGHELLAAANLAASTGSACHSGTHTPSPVLTAMATPPTAPSPQSGCHSAAGPHPRTSTPRPPR